MHANKYLMITINLLGGIAVLGSYANGFITYPDAADALWGGVPHGIRPSYTASMLLATAGYFAFTYFILFCLNPRDTRIYKRFGFGVFNALYAAILVPSALWMPLTLLAVQYSSPGLVWAVRLVLAVVGIASMALLLAIWNVEPRQPLWAHRVALTGSIFFSFQTVILDAILWTVFFQL